MNTNHSNCSAVMCLITTKAQTSPVQFVVDLLYNRSATNRNERSL